MFNVQIHRDHINNGVAAALAEDRQNLLSLIRPHEIIGKDAFYILNALLNDLRIVRTAILTEKELQHIHRNVGSLFDLLCQIFPHDLSVKILTELILQDSSSVIGLKEFRHALASVLSIRS